MLDCAIYGEGPTVVLVHGTGGGRQLTWSDQLPLSRQYRLIVPDRRGYGASPTAEQVDFEVDARDIADLLGPGAHLVGFSYGAVGSLLAAAMRPRAVHSLAVIEPPAFAVGKGEPPVESLISRLEPVYVGGANSTGIPAPADLPKGDVPRRLECSVQSCRRGDRRFDWSGVGNNPRRSRRAAQAGIQRTTSAALGSGSI